MTESALVQTWRKQWFPQTHHPFERYARTVRAALTPATDVLEIGCGRDAWLLSHLAPQYRTGIGIDPVPVTPAFPRENVRYIHGFADTLDLPSRSVDLVLAQSVLEHLEHPERVFSEVSRVLRPGGRWLILTPNFYDYASIAAWLVPNRFHGRIVERTEGRPEVDTFPTVYKANTARDIQQLAHRAGLIVDSLEYWGQYPNYLAFHPLPFLVGSAYAKLTMRVRALAPLRSWLAVSLRAQ